MYRSLVVLGLFAAVLAGRACADDVYLLPAEAPRAAFPDADRFESHRVVSTPALRAAIAKTLAGAKTTVWEPAYAVTTAFRGGARLGDAVVVEEIGKHRAITFVVGVGPRLEVARVAVMTYREAYGGEVRSRRFLAQYEGKSATDPLAPSRDIVNLTGATLSARAIGRGVKKAIAVVAAFRSGEAPAAAAPPPEPSAAVPGAALVREADYVMGTVLEITVAAPSAEVGRRWIGRAVGEAYRLDRELTSFDPASPLVRLNRAAGRGRQDVPADLFRVVAAAKALSRETGGAFDASVGPLVSLWRDAAAHGRWPSAGELAAARALVGSDGIRLAAPSAIELPRAGMALDLGGIGKGYAADRIAERLRLEGASSALVSFGESSIVAVGAPPGESGWPIWVRRGRALDGPLRLRDAALSTSGAFGRTLRIGARRVGHVVDPRSGEAMRRACQATVVAASATAAEAWSKAVLLDPARSLAAMARSPDLGALVVDGGRERVDARFAARTGWSPR